MNENEIRARIREGFRSGRRLEAGVQKNPSVAVLMRLARALRVPVTELLG